MLRTANVANCYAKKLRTAMKWVDLIGLKKSVILNATFLLAKQCCEPLCERFALLGIRRKKRKHVSAQEMIEYMKVQDELWRLPEADANKKYTQIPLNISFFSVNKTLSEAEASTKPVEVCSQEDPGLSLGGGAKRKRDKSQEL